MKFNIDKFYICPHHPEKGFKGEIKKYKISCNCRKPKNSLFKLAYNNYNLVNANVYNIGNNISDMIPGIKTKIKNNILIDGKLKNNLVIDLNGYKKMNFFTLTNKFK